MHAHAAQDPHGRKTVANGFQRNQGSRLLISTAGLDLQLGFVLFGFTSLV